MRGKGINYDTGFLGHDRPFEIEVVERELQIIAGDLHCTAVRVSGEHPERLEVAATCAARAELEVWFAPFPSDLEQDDLVSHFADCARRAEKLRRQGHRVVFVMGCEISLFNHGFVPGDSTFTRIDNLLGSFRSPASRAALDTLQGPLNEFLGGAARAVRAEFSGPVTYASGQWEQVDWSAFDIVSVDLYRDRKNAGSYVETLRGYFTHGKPVSITEFGCCTFRGAAAEGGLGWMVLDRGTQPPRVRNGLVRDEKEQADFLRELVQLFDSEGVDSAFWFTFATYGALHRDDPNFDLDLGAYGVVKMLDGVCGSRYPDMIWEPKESFGALAELYGA